MPSPAPQPTPPKLLKRVKKKPRGRRNSRRRRSTIGTVPGTVLAHTGSQKSSIRVISFHPDFHQDEIIDSVDQLAAFALPTPATSTPATAVADRKKIVWINVDGLGSSDQIKQLGRLFGLHPLALEDVVNVHQRAKLESYGETLFFVARMPDGAQPLQTEQVSIFLCGNVVLTLQERPGDCLQVLRERIQKGKGRIRQQGADYLMYSIVDAIIDGYFLELDRYDQYLDTATKQLESVSDNQLPMRLHDLRSDLLLFRKIARQHRDAIGSLLREPHPLVSPETRYYFRDCQDHISQLLEAADTDREMCGELRELYFARLGQRNNDVMKVLTIIATIFIPLSFVAGVYGMNFNPEVSPYNMPELGWAYGYPFALGLMTLMAAGLLLFMKRKGWLS